MTMSMRPAAGSTCWVNVGLMPPCRMKEPSWTLRTRSNAGLYVIDTVIVDSRVAPAIETGTVYGPAPTRISAGNVNSTRPGAGAAVMLAGAGGGCAGAGVGVGSAATGGATGTVGVAGANT